MTKRIGDLITQRQGETYVVDFHDIEILVKIDDDSVLAGPRGYGALLTAEQTNILLALEGTIESIEGVGPFYISVSQTYPFELSN